MDIALCGLPRSGKTTLWTILTGHEIPAGARPETRKGVVKVPDPRLVKLSALFKPKKETPATLTFVDVAAADTGKTSRADNPMLVELRAADALLVVLRVWDDPADPHPDGSIDPKRDLDSIETEFLLADMEVTQRRIERLDAMIPKTNRDEDKKERDLLQRVLTLLEEETPIRTAGLSEDELRALRGYAFLTAKPFLVAANLPEERIDEMGSGPEAFGLESLVGRDGCAFAAFSAKIEEEISALSEEDAAAFREDLGIAEPALDRLIRASYSLLGLISFFTVGEDECRAWTIRKGTVARRAAGAIHSDLERGFIRAETVRWDALVECGSMATAREKALLRLEGKDYVVEDGDVMHVRHSS